MIQTMMILDQYKIDQIRFIKSFNTEIRENNFYNLLNENKSFMFITKRISVIMMI
jgi:hypothetical protein